MSLDAPRVPAWRRLGLALRNQDPTSAAVPDANTLHSEPPPPPPPQPVLAYENAPPAPRDTHTSPTEPATNGTSSKLGKRKHHAEPEQDDRDVAKKSKTDHAPLETTQTTDTAQPALTTETAQPKGDSNYRKKKEKAPRRSKEKAKPKPKPKAQPTAPSPSEAAPSISQPALLPSTETDSLPPAPSAVQRPPQNDNTRHKDGSGSPSQIDRRKSVAFTADTKTSDGNSGQELFKKWVAEQKGTGEVTAPPAVSNFTLHSLIAEEEKAARQNGQIENKAGAQESSTAPQTLPAEPPPTSQSVPSTVPPSSTATGKKKDPAVYIAYLTQYHADRSHWKFNKAKQNDVVDNALSIFRIPHEHTEALSEYIAGLKGAGVIERLRERCETTLKELDEQDVKKPMDDIQARKVAEQEAEHERIVQERKRRRTEGDVERFMHHPHGEGYIRRLQRKRAEALLTALSRAAPILPATNRPTGINPLMETIAPPQRDARKRKRRTDVSSDESSSDSSSDEESSSDSDSESESGNDDSQPGGNKDNDGSSDSDASSSSGSDSDSDSGSENDSDSD